MSKILVDQQVLKRALEVLDDLQGIRAFDDSDKSCSSFTIECPEIVDALRAALDEAAGPTFVWPDGTQEWYLNDERHREDGPAVIWPNGDQEWWQNGQRHRADGPAYIFSNGTQVWWQNGQRHRADGPAYICANGYQEWWIDGKQLTQEEFEARKVA